MTNAKNTKKALWMSVLSLLLCFSMLLGTTYAWFTDSAVSGSNIIKAGALDAKLYFSDKYLDEDSGDWKNAEGETIFTYDRWEPGYTEVKYLKIENAGNLSFKWRLYIKADGEVTELADVIDVYYVNPVDGTVDSLDGLSSAGVLSKAISTRADTAGVLLPDGTSDPSLTDGSTVIAIAFHMQEEAGNEYMGLSIGDGFSVTLAATQYSYEQDYTGSGYDDNATWPNPVGVGENSASVPVNAVGGLNASAVSVASSNGKVGATIPAGVKLAEGVTNLTLTIKDVEKSEANVTLDENEASFSIDVHIDGVAEDNEVVMAISVKELLPVGLNMGNYRFYHVEDGETVEMTLLSGGATPVHNNYEYDSFTGDVVLYIKSFSEVTLVANNDNEWQGNVADGFAAGSGTENDPYIIVNADQLAYFAHSVGGMLAGQTAGNGNTYKGQYIKLIADIDLGDNEKNNTSKIFYPIGYYNTTHSFVKASGGSVTSNVSSFSGTFDGNGNTISNFYQNTWEMFGDYNDGYKGTPNHYKDGMGLFGYVYNGTVKNLTVENFSSDGEYTPTGVIAAYAAGNSTFENISILNCNPKVYNTGNGGIIGVAGDSSSANAPENTVTLNNITVDQSNKISALWGSYDVACGGLVGMFRGYSNLELNNCHVAAILDVNNDVCGNYQYYLYRYSGMFVGSVRRNTTDANGRTVAYTDNITASGCTYTMGDWNEYWYCELVANSLASYTHDHQFSRLTKISNVSEIQDEHGNWKKAGNFVIPAEDKKSAECYHIMKDAEGNLYQHFHDKVDESNPNIYESIDVNGDGKVDEKDLKEDRVCYYIPFAQLLNGDGWGVTPHTSFEGITAETEDGAVVAIDKFDVKEDAPETYRYDTPIRLGDIFELVVDESVLNKTALKVFVTPLDSDCYASLAISANKDNWENTVITLNENFKGAIKIVITDYYYCNRAVYIINEEGTSEKFVAKQISSNKINTDVAIDTFFDLIDGKTLSGDVTVTATFKGINEKTVTYKGSAEEWENIKLNFDTKGTWLITIKDGDRYCAVTEITISADSDLDLGDDEMGEDFV